MLRTRGHVFVRAISAICVMALVLAACGGSDSSSNRNGRLNSTLCFDTQEDKDAAIADAQRALDEATTPTLEEASPSNNGGRATLAFIGPQLWWMHAASGGSTTTTTQPATTSSTSTTTSTTVSSSTSSSTSTSTTLASSTDSTDVSTDSTDVATDSTDMSTESSVPLISDMVLQQLQDALVAATNAPLCDSTDSSIAEATYRKCVVSWTYGQVDGLSAEPSIDTAASQDCNATISRCILPENSNSCEVTAESNGVQVFAATLNLSGMSGGESRVVTFDWTDGDVPETSDTTVDTTPDTMVDTNEELVISDGEVLCSATIANGLLSFDCAQPISTSFAWSDTSEAAGGDLFGDENTVYSVSENITGARFWVYGYLGLLLDENFYDPNFSATYQFVVPIEDVSDPDSENSGDEENSPFFSGIINPRIGENLVSFTIPEDYSSNDFFMQLYVECGEQTGGAVLLKDGQEVAVFVDMEPYRVLNEGLCGVWLIVEDFSGDSPLGETYDVVITASTETRIMWDGSVPLEGFGVSRDDQFIEEMDDIEWEETISGEITADAIYSISVPVGGRLFEARGITNVFDQVTGEEPFVDPLLVLYDANGDIVAEDDDGGEEYGYGELSSRLRLFLAEGFYTLRATTYEIYYPDEANEFALSRYDLMFRIQAASVDTIKNEGTNEIVDEVVPSSDLPDELAVQVEKLDQAPANLEPPLQPVALPIEQLVNASRKDSDPLPVIPAGVTEVVCSSECLSTLREAAGVGEGVVTIQIGGEAVEIQPSARKATIPVRYSAKNIVVTVTPTDGGQPVVLTTETLVVSPRTFPTKFAEDAKSVMKSAPSNGGIPTNLVVVLVVFALAIAIGIIRRQKVRLPE